MYNIIIQCKQCMNIKKNHVELNITLYISTLTVDYNTLNLNFNLVNKKKLKKYSHRWTSSIY